MPVPPRKLWLLYSPDQQTCHRRKIRPQFKWASELVRTSVTTQASDYIITNFRYSCCTWTPSIPEGSPWCNDPSGSRGDRGSPPAGHALPVAAGASVPAAVSDPELRPCPAKDQLVISHHRTLTRPKPQISKAKVQHKITYSHSQN